MLHRCMIVNSYKLHLECRVAYNKRFCILNKEEERRLESRQFDAGITENRRELELQHSDSRWKLESQQSDAQWEKNMQLLRSIISSKPGGEVAAVDKESSRVEEEDQQVEIRWKQLEARSEAHWRRMDAKLDALRESIDVKAEGLVDKEEMEVSKEVSMGEFLCLCKGIDGRYVQMNRTFDAFLFLDSIKVSVSSQMELVKVPIARRNASLRELAVTLNVVTNLTRLPVRYPKPLVKMKFMVVPVDSCRVFKGGGMTRVTHMHVQYDEMIGVNLGKQFDLDMGRLQRVTRGIPADDGDGIFKFADDAVIQTLCGLTEPMKEPNVSSSPPLQILILGLSDGVLQVLFTYGDIYLGGDDSGKGVADWVAVGFKNEDGRGQLNDKRVLGSLLKMEHFALTQSNISMPFIIVIVDRPKQSETTLTRAKFKGVCSDLLGSGELVKKVIGSEIALYLESKGLMLFVQYSSKPFGNVEGISRIIDNMLEAIEGLGWVLASSPEHVIPVVYGFGNATNSDNIIHNKVRLKLTELSQELQLKGASKTPYCQFAGCLAPSRCGFCSVSDSASYSFFKLVTPSLRTRKLKGRVLMHDKIKKRKEKQGKGRIVFYL